MRVLFTVALLVAIAAIALPAVETAGVDRAESQAQGAIDRLSEAAHALTDGNDALASRADAARQSVDLDLPDGGFASARLATVRIGPVPASDVEPSGTDGGDSSPAATRVVWRVEGGQRHVTYIDGLRIRGAEGGEFRISGGGSRRVVLRLLERNEDRVVTIEPVGG